MNGRKYKTWRVLALILCAMLMVSNTRLTAFANEHMSEQVDSDACDEGGSPLKRH